MQRLLQNLLRGDLAFGGHVEHGQADRREHRLLHDQNRCDKRRIAQNVRGDRQADVVGIEVQRIQCTDGGVRGLHVEEQPVENQKDHAHQQRRKKRHDDGGMKNLEDFLLGQDGEHQARTRHEEAKPIKHHLRARPADTHTRGHIAGRDDDADDAETFHRA